MNWINTSHKHLGGHLGTQIVELHFKGKDFERVTVPELENDAIEQTFRETTEAQRYATVSARLAEVQSTLKNLAIVESDARSKLGSDDFDTSTMAQSTLQDVLAERPSLVAVEKELVAIVDNAETEAKSVLMRMYRESASAVAAQEVLAVDEALAEISLSSATALNKLSTAKIRIRIAARAIEDFRIAEILATAKENLIQLEPVG